MPIRFSDIALNQFCYYSKDYADFFFFLLDFSYKLCYNIYIKKEREKIMQKPEVNFYPVVDFFEVEDYLNSLYGEENEYLIRISR